LASLDTRQQVLLMGHAVPMPVVVQTRTYDEEFYRAVGSSGSWTEDREINATDIWGKKQ